MPLRLHVIVWGTGMLRREFLHSDDMARACVFLMNMSDEQSITFFSKETVPIVNIGAGKDLTIRELAEMIANVVGFSGKLLFDTTKPDGTPQKLLDVSWVHALGWYPEHILYTGIVGVYRDFLEMYTYV